MLKKLMFASAMTAAMFGTGAAFAQSHSVTNYSNPPNESAASKAATEATPGKHATTESNSGQGTKSSDDAKASKSKPAKHKKTTATRAKVKVDPDISKAQAGNDAKETMQRDPSEAAVNDTERHAFDKSPAAKQ